jgi:PKD repeat protein
MYKSKLFNYLTTLVAMLIFSGCSKDDTETDSGIKPVADFSFTNDGSTFTFTNLSKNGTNYRWDFGDLYYHSYEKDPVYTYKIGGEILVSLTVTNEAGEESYVAKKIMAPEIIIINIDIDGNFNDWKDVAIAREFTEVNRSIKKMKFYTKGEFINMYFEGTSAMELPVIDLLINTDENAATGYTEKWSVGADYLYEGPVYLPTWGSFYKYVGISGPWSWTSLSGTDTNFEASGVIAVDAQTNAVELRIRKSYFGTLGKTIDFGMFVSYGAEVYPDNTDVPITIEIQ